MRKNPGMHKFLYLHSAEYINFAPVSLTGITVKKISGKNTGR